MYRFVIKQPWQIEPPTPTTSQETSGPSSSNEPPHDVPQKSKKNRSTATGNTQTHSQAKNIGKKKKESDKSEKENRKFLPKWEIGLSWLERDAKKCGVIGAG